MASYGFDYQLDGGFFLKSVALSVFIVNLESPIVGSPFGGERIGTTVNFDASYLPENLIKAAKLSCYSLPIPAPRHARAYLSDTRYLYIPCPFRAVTPDFLQFFAELVNNNLIRFVEIHGESVGSQYTLNFANR